MTTTEEHLPEITTACQSYCTLPPGHPVDNLYGDDRFSRIHRRPSFGPYLHASAEEFAHEPGVLHPAVDLTLDQGQGLDLTPTDLMLLVVHAVEARDWLVEARRTDVLR